MSNDDARMWSRERILACLYDWEHDRFDADLDFYQVLASRTGGPILELACGTGRVLARLAGAGHDVVGIDRSEAMLARAAVRCGGDPHVKLLQADIRDDLPDERFALAILALDGLGHIERQSDQIALLRRIRGQLAPQGVLAIDLVNTVAWQDQPEGVPILQESGAAAALGAEVTKWIVRRSYPAQASLELRVLYDLVWSDSVLTRLSEEVRLRYFSRFEVELLLQAAGFDLDGLYGDYELGPFVDDSERMVAVATFPSPR